MILLLWDGVPTIAAQQTLASRISFRRDVGTFEALRRLAAQC